MPRSFAQIAALLTAVLLCGACAQVKNVRVEPREAFSEAIVVDRHYWKKGAITLKPEASTAFGRQSENLLLQTLVKTMRHEADRLRLLAPEDNQFPDFMKSANPFSDPQASFEIFKKARLQGYHCLLEARVLDILPVEKKEGIWWFRGTKYYLNVVVSLDLYDPFTAAKISSQVMEKLVKVRLQSYEGFKTGMPDGIKAVDKAIVDMAEEMGGLAVVQIENTHWMALVADLQGLQVQLTEGSDAGLKPGDRFSIFEGRRLADGLNGERFIVPGYKVGDIEIVSVSPGSAAARIETPSDIQPGDIAVPEK